MALRDGLLRGIWPLGLADARLAVRCAPATAIAAARRCRRTDLSMSAARISNDSL